jgi:hypothetical protein
MNSPLGGKKTLLFVGISCALGVKTAKALKENIHESF